jgi:ribosomal protein S1
VNLEKDITGLIHVTELSHEKISDPSEVVKIGQKIEAQVINIDIDERRIGLSMKILQPIDAATLEKLKQEKGSGDAEKTTKKKAKKSESEE